MADFSDNIDLQKKIKDLQYSLMDKEINGTLSISEEQTLKAIENKDWNSGDLNKFLQGVTKGGSDEMIAYGKSAFNDPNRKILANALKKTGDTNDYSQYDIQLALENKDLDENVGVRAGASEMAGNVLPSLLLSRGKNLGKYLNPKGVPKNLRNAGIEGAIYGFNTGRGGFGPRLDSALKVGGISTLIGGAFGLGKNVSGAISNKIKPYFQNPEKAGIKQARKLVNDVLTREGMTAKDAIEAVIQGKDSKMILADIGEGTELAQFVRAIDSLDLASYNEARKILKKRADGSTERLVTLFTGNNKLGKNIDAVMALKKVRQTEGKPLYRKAFYNINQKNGTQTFKTVPITENLKGIMSRPSFKDIFNKTKNLIEEDGKKFDLRLIDGVLYKTGSDVPLKNVPLVLMDKFKKGYDGVLTDFYNVDLKLPSSMQLAINKSRVNFLKELDSISPDYKIARDKYAGTFDIARALELGEKLPKIKTKGFQEIMDKLALMNKSEKEAFMIGAQNELTNTLLDGTDMGGAFVNRLVDSPRMRSILKFAFTGNADLKKKSAKFDTFFKKLNQEIDNKITNQTVVGNSATSTNIAVQKAITKTDKPLNAITLATEALKSDLGELNSREATALGKEFKRILTTFDQDDLRVIQQQLDGGDTWVEIVKKYPRAFKTIGNSIFSPQSAAYLGTQADEYGATDYVEGTVKGVYNAIPF